VTATIGHEGRHDDINRAENPVIEIERMKLADVLFASALAAAVTAAALGFWSAK
jgi:hypothetical protein